MKLSQISRFFTWRLLAATTALFVAVAWALTGCVSSIVKPGADASANWHSDPSFSGGPETRVPGSTRNGAERIRMQSNVNTDTGVTANTESRGPFGDQSAVTVRAGNPTYLGKGLEENPRPVISELVPPQSLPSRDEELWVIQKPAAAQAEDAKDEIPGSGALMAKRTPDAKPEDMVAVPLKHTDVKASVTGYIATVDVTQQFTNPFNEKIEAVYVFPLPHNAAVSEFVMTIGDRRIRGIIRERQEAEKIYREARQQGYVASLLTQDRPNIFTQSVANIEPGKQIDIDIHYFNTLSYSDGWYEFTFPMVVGPRFNPPGTTDGVGAVGQGARGASGQKTEITYLRPEKRSGHDISLSVDVDAGVAIERVESRSYSIKVKQASPSRVQVALDAGDSIPNRDFVLRCKVAGDKTKSGVIAHKSEKNGYFTLMLVPPENLSHLPRKPLEFVFTLDVSGSMSGKPIEQAKSAIRYALTHMGPDDTFQVVKFADDAEQMARNPLPVNANNVRRAMKYLDSGEAGGGTMMLEGMRRSLAFRHDESRLRCVSFLTDGYIGNESEILGSMHGWLGDARVFSFGVGQACNRYLLDHMAKMGNGAAAYLSLNDNAEEVMQAYFDRISHPALTNVSIDWGGMTVNNLYPQKLPDLFVGRPMILTGKYEGTGPTTVKVCGKVGNETQTLEIHVNLDRPQVDSKALPALWARARIADLGDRATYEGGNELAGEVKQIALEYGLMSSFTAFLAVDSLTQTAGDHGTSVQVPVPVPEGVRYDTTVTEAKGVLPAEARPRQ